MDFKCHYSYILKMSRDDALSNHPWFAAQPPALREAIRTEGRPITLAADRLAYLEGDADIGLWLVLDGLIRLDMATGAEGTVMIGLAGGGGLFGRSRRGGLENAAPISRIVTARAMRPTTAFLLSDSAMTRIGADQPAMWQALGQALQTQLDAALAGIMGLLLGPRQRVAMRIIQTTRDGAVMLTQAELAELCGLSRKTVNGHLHTLERAGLLTRAYGRIAAVDVAGLHQIIDGP